MTAPSSPLVLGPAALLTAPALWDTFVAGTLPMETGLLRLAVAVGVVWVGLAMLGTLLTPVSSQDGHDTGVGTTGPASTSTAQVSDPTS